MSNLNQVISESVSYNINRYISVTAANCTLDVTGYGDSSVLTVSNIKDNNTSKLYFTAPSSYPLADENWFHFTNASKNVYFDNNIHINPTGAPGVTVSFISFTKSPTAANTGNATSPISANFDIVNENGNLNDPTLKIVW
jgi:hypothetical protein